MDRCRMKVDQSTFYRWQGVEDVVRTFWCLSRIELNEKNTNWLKW